MARRGPKKLRARRGPKKYPKLAEYARKVGAIDSEGRIDLLQIIKRDHPELFGDATTLSKDDWPYLVLDVAETRWQMQCGVSKACAHLAAGHHPHRLIVSGPDGQKSAVRVASREWKGMDAEMLRVRYQEAIRTTRRAKAQAKVAAEK